MNGHEAHEDLGQLSRDVSASTTSTRPSLLVPCVVGNPVQEIGYGVRRDQGRSRESIVEPASDRAVADHAEDQPPVACTDPPPRDPPGRKDSLVPRNHGPATQARPLLGADRVQHCCHAKLSQMKTAYVVLVALVVIGCCYPSYEYVVRDRWELQAQIQNQRVTIAELQASNTSLHMLIQLQMDSKLPGSCQQVCHCNVATVNYTSYISGHEQALASNAQCDQKLAVMNATVQQCSAREREQQQEARDCRGQLESAGQTIQTSGQALTNLSAQHRTSVRAVRHRVQTMHAENDVTKALLLATSTEKQQAVESARQLRKGLTTCERRSRWLEDDNEAVKAELHKQMRVLEDSGADLVAKRQEVHKLEIEGNRLQYLVDSETNKYLNALYESALNLANTEDLLSRLTTWVMHVQARKQCKDSLLQYGSTRLQLVHELQRHNYPFPAETRLSLLSPKTRIGDGLEAFAPDDHHANHPVIGWPERVVGHEDFGIPPTEQPTQAAADQSQPGSDDLLTIRMPGVHHIADMLLWSLFAVMVSYALRILVQGGDVRAMISSTALQLACYDIVVMTVCNVVFWRFMFFPLWIRRLTHLGFSMYNSVNSEADTSLLGLTIALEQSQPIQTCRSRSSGQRRWRKGRR